MEREAPSRAIASYDRVHVGTSVQLLGFGRSRGIRGVPSANYIDGKYGFSTMRIGFALLGRCISTLGACGAAVPRANT
jgi:hypothetical protein